MASTRALAQTKESTLTTRQSIEHVMKGKRRPMSVGEIFEQAFPLTELRGRHPKQGYYSLLYSEKAKENGLVVQVDRGTFKLNPQRRRSSGKARA
jgi:hypothetical protein